MGMEIGCSYKYNRSKILTPTLKKPVLSSSANHKSYTTSLSQTIISSQLENEDSIAIQNTSEILNTDYIHSCVTSLKKNISVQAIYTPPRLTPLITTLPILPMRYQKQYIYPRMCALAC